MEEVEGSWGVQTGVCKYSTAAHEICQRLLLWAAAAKSLPPPLQGAREQRRELRGGKRLTANMSGEGSSRHRLANVTATKYRATNSVSDA